MWFGGRPCNRRKLLQVVRNLCLLQRKSSLTFVIAFFPRKSIRSLTTFLSQRYQQHSKPMVGTMSFHHNEITNIRIVGHLLPPSCSCHQDENQVEKNTDIDNVTVKLVLGTFYRVRYTFENKKGGTTLKFLPAVCERNDL